MISAGWSRNLSGGSGGRLMATFFIKYRLVMENGNTEEFLFDIDAHSLELVAQPTDPIPFWTNLDFHQCPNCPLSVSDRSDCPLCLRLAPIVARFSGILSHNSVTLEVETQERTIRQSTSMQRALGSMMGMVIAVSGCPHTTYFKPMARFHLPLSTEEETVYRAVSMYLLAQYFLRASGGTCDLDLNGLRDIYAEMHQVNLAILKRMTAAITADSSVNAVIILDTFAKCVPYVIDESLEELEYLFQAYGGQ
jgi:hypothetical protein